MTKFGKLIFFIAFLLILLVVVFFLQRKSAVPVTPVVKDTQVIDMTEPPIGNKDMLLGNKDDLISFSIAPNSKVHGLTSYRGIIQGGYFFEANILINILDKNKKLLKASNATAKGEWMTAGPVNFEGNIDFSLLAKGPAYFEIHNDNPSGLPKNDKSVLIPIIIE